MQCIAERYYSVLLPPGRLLLSAQILLRIAERGRSVGLLLGKTFNYSISQTQSPIFSMFLLYFLSLLFLLHLQDNVLQCIFSKEADGIFFDILFGPRLKSLVYF